MTRPPWSGLPSPPTVGREYEGVMDSSPLQNSGVKTLEVLTQQHPGSVCVCRRAFQGTNFPRAELSGEWPPSNTTTPTGTQVKHTALWESACTQPSPCQPFQTKVQ